MLRLMSEVLAGRRPPIRLAGHSFLPVAAGALYWESEDTLLVADLHLEKGAAFAARGMMLPPYDTRSTLQRLAACLDHFSPRRVVALGEMLERQLKLFETMLPSAYLVKDIQRVLPAAHGILMIAPVVVGHADIV